MDGHHYRWFVDTNFSQKSLAVLSFFDLRVVSAKHQQQALTRAKKLVDLPLPATHVFVFMEFQ